MQPLIDVASYRREKDACFALFTLYFCHVGKFAEGELVDLYLFFIVRWCLLFTLLLDELSIWILKYTCQLIEVVGRPFCTSNIIPRTKCCMCLVNIYQN
jgi:hypothetical protein